MHLQKLRLKKSTFLTDPSLGDITDFSYVKSKGRLAIAGTTGAVVVNSSGEPVSKVTFATKMVCVSLVPLNAARTNFRYLNRGSETSPPCLLDSDGKTMVWKLKPQPPVDDAAYGDVDNTGLTEFAVGYSGNTGVALLDGTGTQRWLFPEGNVWHVEVSRAKNGYPARIVHSNGSGQITVRDSEGTVVSQFRTPCYISKFSLCPWPTRHDRQCILTTGDDHVGVRLFSQEGDVIKEFPFSVDAGFGGTRGTPVKLDQNQGDFLATITSWDLWKPSILCVYKRSGELAYEEVLPERCGSIAVLPGSADTPDKLFVGGTGKVWLYEPK